MRLYEYEGKEILSQAGVRIPQRISLSPLSETQVSVPGVIKAQVLFGNRKQANLIHVLPDPKTFDSVQTQLQEALKQSGADPQKTDILVEELIDFSEELYLAIRYDTRERLPVLLYSAAGGSGIEERSQSSDLTTLPLPQLAATPLPQLHEKLSSEWLANLLTTFFENDMTLLEINPLVFVGDEPVALDAKVEIDDTAAFRHPEWEDYPSRTLFDREPTSREQAAKKVNALDHRGVAGAAYFEFPGTVAILASGGGASLLAMDALLTTDIHPANYTEYSGNPPREKVRALTEIVMSQPNLEGLWVIGGHANFTDIYETLMGVMDAVEDAKQAGKVLPGFPIIIRRGGPRQEEAFAEVKKRATAHGLTVHVYDSSFPITDTVPVLAEHVHAYQEKQRKTHGDTDR